MLHYKNIKEKEICVRLCLMISEFTHVMLKVCVKLAALSAEWPGRRKTYGPGEFMFNYSIRANLTFPRFTSNIQLRPYDLLFSKQ